MKSIKRIRKPDKFQRRLALHFIEVIVLYILVVFGVAIILDRLGFPINSFHSPLIPLIFIGILGLIFSSMSYWLFLHQISAPLSEMNHLFKKLSTGDFSVQAKRRSNIEEVDNCVTGFNQMIERLRSVEVMREDFISNVSHEFKTPLSSIMGYATLLQDSDLTPEERNTYVQKVLFHAERLSNMTENILLLSKLENQTYQPPAEKFRLDEQIREAILMLEQKWTEKNIDLDIDLTEIEWSGQRTLLLQVWFNLIGNAIKYSQENGHIGIKLTWHNKEIRVSISDDGIGMDTQTQAHIFEKFYQGDTSRRAQGNGLGLSLCKEIIKQAHGHIYVTSQLGKGSVFLVTLPYLTNADA